MSGLFIEAVKQPCSACPFRRAAMPGWLGASAPEGFIDCINRDEPLPCHQTIDYADPFWKEKWISQRSELTGKACAGALIFAANIGKLPRLRGFPRAKPDPDLVFGGILEFIAHHRSARVQSWTDGDQLPEVEEMRLRLAPHVKPLLKKAARRG